MNRVRPATEMDSIGLIGAGALGSAVARRLTDLNLKVRVFNRSPEKLIPLIRLGVAPCATALAATETAAILLTAVTDSAALDAVLFGADGALARRPRRQLTVIDIGTHAPAQLTALAEKVTGLGMNFVEAPVTGSVHDAVNGTLNFLVGGDAATVDLVRPFLETMGRNVYHMGPAGAGNTAKLAMNLLVAAMAFGMRESVAMLQASKLDPAKFFDALAGSGLRSPLYQRIGQRYLDGDFDARFSLSNLEKDIASARDRSAELGCPLPMAALMASLVKTIDPDIKAKDYSVLLALTGSHFTERSKEGESSRNSLARITERR